MSSIHRVWASFLKDMVCQTVASHSLHRLASCTALWYWDAKEGLVRRAGTKGRLEGQGIKGTAQKGQQREAGGWQQGGLMLLPVLPQVHRWNCEACGVGYELGSIESALVAVVQQQERSYQLQDLQCMKCKNVSMHTDVLQ